MDQEVPGQQALPGLGGVRGYLAETDKEAVLEDLRVRLDEAREVVRGLERRWLALTGREKRQEARHGTDTGYYAHRRQWRTPTCSDCRTAHAVVERERMARKGLLSSPSCS